MKTTGPRTTVAKLEQRLTELPVLPYAQTKRIDHKLVFRRW